MLSVLSIGFEVDIGSWEVHIAKAERQQHFAETVKVDVAVGCAI